MPAIPRGARGAAPPPTSAPSRSRGARCRRVPSPHRYRRCSKAGARGSSHQVLLGLEHAQAQVFLLREAVLPGQKKGAGGRATILPSGEGGRPGRAGGGKAGGYFVKVFKCSRQGRPPPPTPGRTSSNWERTASSTAPSSASKRAPSSSMCEAGEGPIMKTGRRVGVVPPLETPPAGGSPADTGENQKRSLSSSPGVPGPECAAIRIKEGYSN